MSIVRLAHAVSALLEGRCERPEEVMGKGRVDVMGEGESGGVRGAARERDVDLGLDERVWWREHAQPHVHVVAGVDDVGEDDDGHVHVHGVSSVRAEQWT